MELCHKTLRTILVVVQVNEVSDGEYVFRSEGIGFAVPSGLENGHCFLVSFLSDTLVGIKSSFDAADTVKTALLVIVELKPDSVICFIERNCDGVIAEDLCSDASTCGKRS